MENRYRFLEEMIDEINEVWDGPLFVRLSVNEYHPEGNSIDDIVYFSRKLKEQGVDLIDCSSGAIVPARIDVFPGYQVPLAEKIKQGCRDCNRCCWFNHESCSTQKKF